MDLNINVEELLKKLEEQHKEHKTTSEEVEDLFAQQKEILRGMLEKLKPVYSWYSDNGFVFTHPTIKVRSPFGPILGYDQEENEVIVFNIEKNYPERVYLNNTENRKFYSLYNLVRDGFFSDAVNGLQYLEKMLENYVYMNNEYIKKLKAQIEQI
ncbi:MAG TPA: hypothetical protein VEY70_16050 [Metabacillus sp.]|nr:hypothetical protein [Metabacillus sp.]